MKLYGLFSYTYDYYEWEELEAVSKSPDKLKDLVGKGDVLAESEDEHDQLRGIRGKPHHFIKEVTYIK